MINRVVLVGRLTRDPELRRTANETAVASFTIAVDNRMKGPDGQKTASFIPCTVWGVSADNTAKYTRKGSLVGVEGRLNQRTYDRRDGTKATILEVICDSVQFLEPKGETRSEKAGYAVDEQPADDSKNLDAINIVDDDLPF
ncbi:MAG: single-stranded DNA-binding protein [Erysipelotrichia bacterium]|nr:single-stranded DNA-binding protein [Erysipelotrichia bacterium]